MGNRVIWIALLASLSLRGFCQGYVNYEYQPSSIFKDKEGNKYGSGNLQRISGRYTIPFSRKLNERNQPTAWGMTLSALYAVMDNEGEALELNPDRVLNTSLTVSHLRPLSGRWSLLVSLGCGIYASLDEVRWQSLLANGSFIFAYRLRNNLSIGIGGGLTNSYGVPIIMPMGYLKWKTNGRYEVTIDMANALKMQVATQMGKVMRLELTAIEMDGMSAVMRVGGKQKIYSSMMMHSGLNASFRLFGKATVYTGVGGVWLRSSKITDRDLKSFFKSFDNDSDKDKYRFLPTMRFSAGFRYGF